MKKVSDTYPPALKIIQIINYIAVISSVLLAVTYLFASKDFVLEMNNNIQPVNQYTVAIGYLAIGAVASFVLYHFRKRSKRSPEFYVLANVFSVGIYELIYHYSNYHPSLFESVTVYILEAAIMAYLLFNPAVKAYFNKD